MLTTFRLYPDAPPFSRIALGGSTFARETGQEAAFALMDHARARGVTMIDTAATYTAGASEQVVGAWLASRRPDPRGLVVATKIYPPYTPEAIDTAVAASARRLGREVIDLLYLHKWDAGAETDEALRALDGLVRQGRVRALGVSNFNAEQLGRVLARQRALGLAGFQVLQNNQNVAVRDVDAAVRQICADHGLATVTYSPLGGGFLTGKHRTGVVPGSRFDVAPGHQQVYFQAVAERRLARLEELSRQTGVPMPKLALAWALHQPGVTSVLVGGRGPGYIDQALDALAFQDPTVFAALESA